MAGSAKHKKKKKQYEMVLLFSEVLFIQSQKHWNMFYFMYLGIKNQSARIFLFWSKFPH